MAILWFRTQFSELAVGVVPVALTGVEVPYHTLLLENSFVVQATFTEVDVILFAAIPEITGAIVSVLVVIPNFLRMPGGKT